MRVIWCLIRVYRVSFYTVFTYSAYPDNLLILL